MNIEQPSIYPFNNRSVKGDPTNYFKKYENILFSDKETLTTPHSPSTVTPHSTCITVVAKEGGEQRKNCWQTLY
jgi:hypothetical protein